jgi:predicted membrane protein
MNPALAPAAIVVGTALSYVVGALIGIPVLVPILNVLPAFPLMIGSLRARRVDEAIGRMLVWAAALAICATTISYLAPAEMARLFIHGDAYRREMFLFILTGRGAEGDLRQFLPQHAAHAALFSGLALATGSALAMPLGAVLMNYMGHYVGALGSVSVHPWRALALAWVPWSLVRIASFVILGVVLGGPVLAHVFRFEYRLGEQRRWMLIAVVGLIIDVVMKWAAAPSWRLLIKSAAGW